MHIIRCLIPPLVWTIEVVIYIYDIHKYPFQKLVLIHTLIGAQQLL